MAYLSLYRRRRPLTFSGMTGQEHVARTLSHALARGQLAHAYLFCGPRGTGKTTAAKILARAVNCNRYPVPEPCGSCISCRDIAAGVAMSVIEMDAASNRGIEEIRELRERTRYASSDSRFKVYIIDEAHMLTNEACNAFLKTLEEPPAGVIFILATTDASRLPSTVVSRCQRFDFHLLRADQIMQHLQEIVREEGWQAEEEALRLISRLAEGSMRDALGLLEQCQAYGEEIVTADHVRTVTGVTRVETLAALIDAAAAGDLDSGISVLQQITYSGRDLVLLLRDLTFFFSRLLLSGTTEGPRLEESYFGFEQTLKRFRGHFPKEALLDVVALLHQVSGEIRHAHSPQFVLEVAFIRMLRLLNRPVKHKLPASAEPVPAKPASLEPPPAKKETLQVEAVEPTPVKSAAVVKEPRCPEPALEACQVSSGAASKTADCGVPAQFWTRLLQEVKRGQSSTHDYLRAAKKHAWQGDLLILTYSEGDDKGVFSAARIVEKSHRLLVEEALHKLCARPIRIKAVVSDALEVNTVQAAEETAAAGGEFYEAAAVEPNVTKEENMDELAFDEVVKMFNGQVVDTRDKEDY
ncbi:MAG: DNA polymerase III subunit gamma/tau [Bacillota bacterium]